MSDDAFKFQNSPWLSFSWYFEFDTQMGGSYTCDMKE